LKNSALLEKASAHVRALLGERKPGWAKFHTFEHAKAVAKACREIGPACNLSAEDLELVTLAAWLHDAGYVEGIEGHEERSVNIAASFLHEHRYPEEKIARVAGCIRATRMPQNPSNLLEQVLCDADIAHLASKDYVNLSELVRSEIEHHKGRRLTDAEWLILNIDFMAGHRYFTDYARTRYELRRSQNLDALREQLNRIKLAKDI